MNFLNTLRKIKKIRFYALLFLVGVMFIVISCIVISLPKAELESVDGTIMSIEHYTDPSGEERENVFVSYIDKDGVKHENIPYPSYSSSMKEGKTVTVLYDPDAPEEIQSPGGKYVPYIILAVGVIAAAVSVIKTVSDMKKSESNSPFENSKEQIDPALADEVLKDETPAKEYYFHWTGKLNQSYILETPDREPIYEAICDHIGVLTPYRYTFINRLTDVRREHTVSHTVTTRYGNGNGNTSFSLVSASSFKIDGENCWDDLAKLGYSVEPKRTGIKLNFSVLRHGVPIAYLEAAGTNILKDGAKSALGDKLTAAGLYRVSCKESDIEGVFRACFAVSRVEFY